MKIYDLYILCTKEPKKYESWIHLGILVTFSAFPSASVRLWLMLVSENIFSMNLSDEI